MLSKKEIKDIQSLSHKKHRDEYGLFLAEGPKIVEDLCRLIPERIEKVYALPQWTNRCGTIIHPDKLQEVSEHELLKLTQLQTPNEVIAVIQQAQKKTPSGTEPFTLYLDAIQDPGNLGTIIRIADWFAIKQVVCSKGTADIYNPKVVQATMASLASVQVYYEEETLWLQRQNMPVYAATLHGQSVYQYPKTEKGIFIIGNESKGISDAVLQYATEKITIPKKGGAESLNAAVATGIILSHLL